MNDWKTFCTSACIVPFSATFQLCATEAGIRRLIPSFSKFISPIYFRIRSRRFSTDHSPFFSNNFCYLLAGCCTSGSARTVLASINHTDTQRNNFKYQPKTISYCFFARLYISGHPHYIWFIYLHPEYRFFSFQAIKSIRNKSTSFEQNKGADHCYCTESAPFHISLFLFLAYLEIAENNRWQTVPQ